YNFSYQTKDREEFYNEDIFVTNDLTYQEIKREVNLEPVKLLGKIKAKSNAIVLNTIVLNNPKNKKPVSGATIVLEENGSGQQTLTANDKGRNEGVVLKSGTVYTIYAESEGKKSKTQTISTSSVKTAKVINQILFIDGSSSKQAGSALLDVVVYSSRTNKKPVSNATVLLTDGEGNKVEATTDANGRVKAIELSESTNYELYALKEDGASEHLMFTTSNLKGAKVIRKTLYMDNMGSGDTGSGTSGGSSVAGLSDTEYEFYFKYNRTKIDDAETIWTNFVNKVVEMSKEKVVVVSIKSSASFVPTRAFTNNKELARSRARATREKLREAVEAKGGNMENLKVKYTYGVNGPEYRSDFRKRRAKYEKHQYVKLKAYSRK
ncbi:MAG: hypothetical protein QM534_18890, partial [Sediminibacterium sp.]|nr:hypothetical protein [Sediminibacterium sp.]